MSDKQEKLEEQVEKAARRLEQAEKERPVLLAEELERCVARTDAFGDQVMPRLVNGDVAQKGQPDCERVGHRPF